MLLIASSALIFHSMFGKSSDFLTSELHGFGNATPHMVLTGTPGQCAVQSAETSTDLLPVGVETRRESYNPTFISGSTHGTADQVAARLFASSLVGIVAGVAVALQRLCRSRPRPSAGAGVGCSLCNPHGRLPVAGAGSAKKKERERNKSQFHITNSKYVRSLALRRQCAGRRTLWPTLFA